MSSDTKRIAIKTSMESETMHNVDCIEEKAGDRQIPNQISCAKSQNMREESQPHSLSHHELT